MTALSNTTEELRPRAFSGECSAWDVDPSRVKPSDGCNPGCQPDCDLKGRPPSQSQTAKLLLAPDLRKYEKIIHASCCLKLTEFQTTLCYNFKKKIIT